MPEVTLSQGTLNYQDTGGNGPIVVLVHGAFADGRLWRKVVPLLAPRYRVVVPDMPLGSHRTPMNPGTDFTLPGLATLVADFLAALDLRDVTLVGNDSGGAISQRVAADHPDRLAALVLTNCDSHENFLPPAFRYLQLLIKIPGAMAVLAHGMRFRMVRRAPIAFGLLSHREPEPAVEWTKPLQQSKGIRRDTLALLRGISNSYTLEAAEQLKSFDKPVLIAWGERDPFFKPRFAQRLADEIPGARLAWIENSRAFVPEDAPESLAALIGEFVTV